MSPTLLKFAERVEKTGMNYKGFNIAVHEMGHNVEQTFSLNDVDYTLLQGVPNVAFTEALAFVFQAQDLALLGLASPDATTEAMKTLNELMSEAKSAHRNLDGTIGTQRALTEALSKALQASHDAEVEILYGSHEQAFQPQETALAAHSKAWGAMLKQVHGV